MYLLDAIFSMYQPSLLSELAAFATRYFSGSLLSGSKKRDIKLVRVSFFSKIKEGNS